jgi:hypothetical protein
MALRFLVDGIVLISDRVANTRNLGIPPGKEDHPGEENRAKDEGISHKGESLEQREHEIGDQATAHGRGEKDEKDVPMRTEIDTPRYDRQEHDAKKAEKELPVLVEMLPSVGDFRRLIVGVGSFLGMFGGIGAHAFNLMRVEAFAKRQVR